jgi:hypothetical protein
VIFLDHTARLAFIAGAVAGGGGGFWLGGCAWRLVMRNPLAGVIRAYRELFADIRYLCETGELRQRGRRNWRGVWR